MIYNDLPKNDKLVIGSKEEHAIALQEAAMFILARAVGKEGYRTMPLPVRRELLDDVGKALITQHPLIFHEFKVHLQHASLPTRPEVLDFMIEIRDKILVLGEGNLPASIPSAERETILQVLKDSTSETRHVAQLTRKLIVEKNTLLSDEALVQKYIPKELLESLRANDQDKATWESRMTEVANFLRSGKVDLASLVNLGLNEEGSSGVEEKMNDELSKAKESVYDFLKSKRRHEPEDAKGAQSSGMRR